MRKWLWWAIQGVVAVVVGWMVWRAITRNWSEFRSLHVSLTLQWQWLVVSVLAILSSYATSVEAWRRILAGWAQHLPYGRAARIWLIANLGRYVPGKIWSVAGLMVMAQRAGVEAWAATASAFVIQAVSIGTAVAFVAAAAPGAASPWRLAGAGLVAAGTIAVLAWPWAVRNVARLVGSAVPIRPLPVVAVAESAVFGLLSWTSHGVGFWLLARGLGLPSTLPMTTAAGIFAFGYILGLLALFAPGGVGVREVVLIGLLTPGLGAGGAVVLSVASRIVLTLTEVVTPLVVLLIARRPHEPASA